MHILHIELLLKLLDMLRRSLRLILIQAAVAAHPYELEILRCRTSQFARCFLPVYVRAWNGLSDAVFEKVRGWLPGCWRFVVFQSFFSCFLGCMCLWGCSNDLQNNCFFSLRPGLVILIIIIIIKCCSHVRKQVFTEDASCIGRTIEGTIEGYAPKKCSKTLSDWYIWNICVH